MKTINALVLMLQFNFARPQRFKVCNLQMVKSLELSKESSNFVSSRFKRLRGLFLNQTPKKVLIIVTIKELAFLPHLNATVMQLKSEILKNTKSHCMKMSNFLVLIELMK